MGFGPPDKRPQRKIFKIDLSSEKPVYRQLIDQVKYAVASGSLRVGDRLPTIREVATENRINRNTVAKAYTELEREGVTYSRVGRGSFISDRGTDISRSQALLHLSQQIDALLVQAHHFRISPEELLEVIEKQLQSLQAKEPARVPEKVSREESKEDE